eukprot:02501_5
MHNNVVNYHFYWKLTTTGFSGFLKACKNDAAYFAAMFRQTFLSTEKMRQPWEFFISCWDFTSFLGCKPICIQCATYFDMFRMRSRLAKHVQRQVSRFYSAGHSRIFRQLFNEFSILLSMSIFSQHN